jgi:flagellar basal-body rod protein FlgB
MGISFEKAFGLHENAVHARIKRAEILANNLANADTPGFKARDIDFGAVMQGAKDSQSLAVSRTNPAHLQATVSGDEGLLYRTPLQPSLDGNTVDTQTELVEYSRNALDYQASFQFLNDRMTGLSKAIKGE